MTIHLEKTLRNYIGLTPVGAKENEALATIRAERLKIEREILATKKLIEESEKEIRYLEFKLRALNAAR